MFKRITLFILTNIFVMVTISIVLNVLGVGHYVTRAGLDYYSLMIFCLVWGMGGAFISLAISRMTAKWAMGVQVINPNSAGEYSWLVQAVQQLSRSAQLPAMPEVGVYESPDVNAFATGPTKSRALVAVSTGLLRTMDKNQIQGILGHEIAHIANGDMVTMTLLQGVINAFVMFLARVIAFAVSNQVKEESRYWVNFIVVMVLQIGLGFLGMIIVAWFSRQREYRADAGGAKYGGRTNMTSALEALQSFYNPETLEIETERAPSLAAMKISGKKKGFSVFATHPPLEDRIAKLKSISLP
jgi:heat shock protein HtpX